jgi:hypothetical protein
LSENYSERTWLFRFTKSRKPYNINASVFICGESYIEIIQKGAARVRAKPVLSMDHRASILEQINSTGVFQKALANQTSAYMPLRASLKGGQVVSLWGEIETTSAAHDFVVFMVVFL